MVSIAIPLDSSLDSLLLFKFFIYVLVSFYRSPTRYTSSEEDELPAARKRKKTSKSRTNPTCTLAVSQPIPSTCIPTPPIRLTIASTTLPSPILTRPESAPATPVTTRHVTTPTRAVTTCTLTTPLTTPRPATLVITPTTHNTRPPNGSISGLYWIYYAELKMPFSALKVVRINLNQKFVHYA